MGDLEQVARALNLAGWTCSDGAHEPGDYGRCEACANTCDRMASAVLATLTPTRDICAAISARVWDDGYRAGQADSHRLEPYSQSNPYREATQ